MEKQNDTPSWSSVTKITESFLNQHNVPYTIVENEDFLTPLFLIEVTGTPNKPEYRVVDVLYRLEDIPLLYTEAQAQDLEDQTWKEV
ncbi:hypothetical protein [Paenibacillus sp. FSL K6-2859]|uniref:hypothetical protein n=1 Tax=Paenibacillus sp. FSL K6-2859 TaxID=2921482 RepID=UPI0030FAC276